MPGKFRRGASLETQEPFHDGDGARRVFLLRSMTEVVEHHERRALDFAVESAGGVERNQPVASTPDDEGRHLDVGEARGRAWHALAEPVDQSAAVSLPLVERDCTV